MRDASYGYTGGGESRSSSSLRKWVAGLALVVALILTFAFLQLFQLTSEGTATETHRRVLNAVVEGDGIIRRNYDDLQARAEASEQGATLELRDYPVAVPLNRDEALALSKDGLRALLLDRGSERMYEEGEDAFRGEGGSDAPGRFTAAGVVDEFVGFLRQDVHGILAVLTFVLAGISALLALALTAACRGFGRLAAVGFATLTASLPLLAGGFGVWASARGSDADGEYLRAELMDVGASLAWLPLRNGIIFALLGAAMLALGVIAARWTDARR